ncbi:hypothetical protein AMJ80_01845 [bacterium SM23_31]|nr:MAG: hypothetical protein AMJ80_01845 [bacterium SM23_31]
MFSHYSFKNNIIALILFISIYLFPDNCTGQILVIQESSNPFNVYFLNFPSETPGSIRAIVLVQVSYNKMRFLKKGDMYVAKYEFSIEITDGNDNIVERKYWDQEFALQSFEETLDKNEIFLEHLEFDLKPGIYRYYAEMTDTDSRKSFYRRDSKVFPPYWVEIVGISDVVFTEGRDKNALFDNLIPFKEEEIKIDYFQGFSIRFQLFSADLKPVEFSWRLINFMKNKEILLSDSSMLEPTTHTTNISIFISGEEVPAGTYILYGLIKHPSGRKSEVLPRIKITWINLPISSFDINASLEQMMYILPDKDKNQIKNMSIEEKRSYFENFWNTKDPTPGTKRNELMEEYFRRVIYTNELFSFVNQPGWKTDRGRIFCIYGKPDRREPVEFNVQQVPQEIWTYYTARKIFTFADNNRNGDYKLISEEDIIR